jgi:hypothetical protein
MHGPFIVTLWLAGAITLASATHGDLCEHQPPAACDAAAVAEFTVRVQEYVRVQHDATRGLPRERLSDDPGELLADRDALRRAIREARPDARTGDLFTPRTAAAFRHIVTATAAAHRVNPKDIVRTMRAERAPGAKQPAVNGPYDWRLGGWMWPALLQALPLLPPDLQYRIVDDDLVLVDLRASLVVDILEDAMAVDED